MSDAKKDLIIENILNTMTYAELHRAVLSHGKKIGVYEQDSINHDKATLAFHLAVSCLIRKANREVYSYDMKRSRRQRAVANPDIIYIMQGKNSVANLGSRPVFSPPKPRSMLVLNLGR